MNENKKNHMYLREEVYEEVKFSINYWKFIYHIDFRICL